MWHHNPDKIITIIININNSMGKVVVGNNGVEIQLTIDYKTITIIIMEVIH